MYPYKTIMASILLFLGGLYFLMMGWNSWGAEVTYNAEGEREGPTSIEVIILGMLLFIPGSYHVAVAMLAYFN